MEFNYAGEAFENLSNPFFLCRRGLHALLLQRSCLCGHLASISKQIFFCVGTSCVFVINDRWNRPFCSININISINKHAPGGVNVLGLFKEKSKCMVAPVAQRYLVTL